MSGKMGIKDGSYQYDFDNGQLWTGSQFKNNSMFTILSSFDRNGKPRDKGTLKDGKMIVEEKQ
jgi:antitoxin component YwqK of YwqJK toxin-antitoxin module